MKFTINYLAPITYTKFKNLTFAPEIGIIGDQIPINEIVADIIVGASNEINDDSVGFDVTLTDDRNTLFADGYVITEVKRIDKKTVRVVAKSRIIEFANAPGGFSFVGFSDRVTFQEMFEQIPLPYTIPDYYIHPVIAARLLYGVSQGNDGRELLTNLCFAYGAYVKTYNNSRLEILPVPYDTISGASAGTPTVIPRADTYYKPTMRNDDVVNAVSYNSYTFYTTEQQDKPYIEDPWGNKYWYSIYVDKYDNPHVSEQSGVNKDITIDSLLEMRTAYNIPQQINKRYFQNTVVEMDVINNGVYWPGQYVAFYIDDTDQLYAGFISSANFSFGKQAMSKLRVESVVPYNPA